MSKYIYFHIWDNHFKMWGYESYRNEEKKEYRILCYWGKIANSLSKLQSKEKVLNWFGDAYDFISKKVDEKINKGYVAVKNTEYTKYSSGEITLSQLINIIESEKPPAKIAHLEG